MTSYNGYLSSLQTLHPLQPPGEAKEATRCQEEAAASRHVLVDAILFEMLPDIVVFTFMTQEQKPCDDGLR